MSPARGGLRLKAAAIVADARGMSHEFHAADQDPRHLPGCGEVELTPPDVKLRVSREVVPGGVPPGRPTR